MREALAGGGLLELFVHDPDRHLALVTTADQAGAVVTEVSAPVLAAMCETVTPQGVVGLAPLVDVPLEAALGEAPRLLAVLDQVRDPGNAGTVVRVADAAGADAVIFTAGSVDPHNGKCVRATAGSLWHLPVVSGPTLDDTIAAVRGAGLAVLAATGRGAEDLDALAESGALRGPAAWLFGTEADGLGGAALEAADRTVRIPLHGRAESLNLATAAAICLYSSAREQRRSHPAP